MIARNFVYAIVAVIIFPAIIIFAGGVIPGIVISGAALAVFRLVVVFLFITMFIERNRT